MLIASHDFRFFEDIEGLLLADGHRIHREFWGGHNAVLDYGARHVADSADVIFCDWCMGNAVWWSKNKSPSTRLVIRFHSQELFTDYPRHVDYAAVEHVVFVSPEIMRQAIEKFPIPPAICSVLPISVPFHLAKPYTPEEAAARRDVIGMVGLTPWLKRPDKALDLLEHLRRRYPALKLRLRGRPPSNYAWMARRTDELERYTEVFRRLTLAGERGIVEFEDYGEDMEEFYRGIGWILSVSDREGCHTAVAEGALLGCLPLMTRWPGADEVYPPELSFSNLDEVAAWFDSCYADHAERAEALRGRFTVVHASASVARQWAKMLFRDGKEEG